MDENTMNSSEVTETTDGFMEGWDEPEAGEAAEQDGGSAPDPVSQSSEDRREDAEAPAGEQQDGGNAQSAARETNGGDAGEDAAAQNAETRPQADAPRLWNLRYMDADRQVGEAEMVTLAQKGLDYDRIREKYDESKPVMELFGAYARQAGMSIPDYLSHLRTQAKQSGGMSEAEARRTVALEDREAAVSAREAEETRRQTAAAQAEQAKASEDARRSADISEFQRAFPDAAKDPKNIPAEVWADVRSGMSLVSAYSRYAVAQANAARQEAEQRAAAAVQNRKNDARAAGSMRSAGENTGSRDPFLEGFDE